MNLKFFKVKLGQLKAKLRNYQFECFQNRVNIQISKIPESERILWLGNKLLNEIEGQGHNIHDSSLDLTSVNLHHFCNCANQSIEFEISNICQKFNVRGKRDLTV